MVTPSPAGGGATDAPGPEQATRPLVVLTGPPGAGKSTVARALAAELGASVVDTDERIEQRAGMPIPDIFIEQGEPAFRELERQVVAQELASHDGVLALGGGAVMDPDTQEALTGHRVVFLDVEVAEAIRRTGLNQARPLLSVQPRSTWLKLMAARRPTYERLAALTVDTSQESPEAIARRIVEGLGLGLAGGGSDGAGPPRDPRRSETTTIRVGGEGAAGYDVVIGQGLADRVPAMVGGTARRVLLLRPQPHPQLAAPVRAALEAAGHEVHEQALPDAETAKTAQVAADLWGMLGRAGFTRTDAVVAVGGGSVTDLGGFVAATWLRGVRVVQVPTTLLGMVDAAVGGKTGINTPEGKNLVGSFHPPAGVVVDLDALATLPRSDLAAGMAEVVKGGFIRDTRILDLVRADPAAALDVRGPVLPELIRRKIQVKADVVTEDLKESSLREILNYGHTFGHAIEQVEGYTWPHGEAVAVGMVYAAELARLAGRLGEDDVRLHREVIGVLGLPIGYAPGRWEALHTAMTRDKKTRGATLRFVVLDGIGRPGRLEGPSEEMLRAAYDAIS